MAIRKIEMNNADNEKPLPSKSLRAVKSIIAKIKPKGGLRKQQTKATIANAETPLRVGA